MSAESYGLEAFLNRLAFIGRFRTFKKLACDSEGTLHACGSRKAHTLPARCPHQGAALVNASVEGDEVICHWHGCRYHLEDRLWRSANACSANARRADGSEG